MCRFSGQPKEVRPSQLKPLSLRKGLFIPPLTPTRKLSPCPESGVATTSPKPWRTRAAFFVVFMWIQCQSLVQRNSRTSLVVQWLRICLPMQGTWVQSSVWKDPTCWGATKPRCHNYWSTSALEPVPRNKKPLQWEAQALQWRVAPTLQD